MRRGAIRNFGKIARELREGRKARKAAAAASNLQAPVISGRYEIRVDGVKVDQADTITVALNKGVYHYGNYDAAANRVITVRDTRTEEVQRYDPNTGYVKEFNPHAVSRVVQAPEVRQVQVDVGRAIEQRHNLVKEHQQEVHTALAQAHQEAKESYGKQYAAEGMARARARMEEREARRLERLNRRRTARGQMELFEHGTPGDKPGHPFRGNQYKKES